MAKKTTKVQVQTQIQPNQDQKVQEIQNKVQDKTQVPQTPMTAIDISKIPNKPELYKMFFETVQASAIRTLSESLKEILTEVNIHFDDSGIRIATMDKDRVAFIHLKLEAENFEKFYCPVPFTIGISLMNLHKILKTIGNSDIVSLFILKSNQEKLCIRIENTETNTVDKTMLNLMDLDKEDLTIPNISFESIFHMPCANFQKHCRDLSVLSEIVTIRTKNDGDIFTMISTGDFADKKITIGQGHQGQDDDDEEGIYIGTFEIKFLNLFSKNSSLCPSVEIYLKENYPIILMYSVANLGVCRLGLSPKIVI